MGDHDHAYKILFSHPRMVRDLLEGFVNGELPAQLDFDTLERVSDNYVSDDLRSRADDIVWRIRCCNHYVYLLIEFQSTNEPFMAVRVLAYEGLLFQDIIRTRRLEAGDELPAILSIVLYSGRQRWSAAQDLASLFSPRIPRGVADYGPQCRYLLIDESRYAEGGRAVSARELSPAGTDTGDREPFDDRAGIGKGTAIVNDLWEEQTMLSETVKEWVYCGSVSASCRLPCVSA